MTKSAILFLFLFLFLFLSLSLSLSLSLFLIFITVQETAVRMVKIGAGSAGKCFDGIGAVNGACTASMPQKPPNDTCRGKCGL